MAKLVGNRYGNALFEAGLELDKLEDFQGDLELVLASLKEEPRLETILAHPKISKGEKRDLLREVFGKNISQELLNFLYIIVDKRRERYLFAIGEEFTKLFNQHKNITEVTALTAVTMKEEAREQLRVILGKKLGKDIRIKNLVDPSLLGGVLLKIEGKIIDGSIRSQLETIERNIKTGIL